MTDHRRWHQKLRYWVLGVFLIMALLEFVTGGEFPEVSDRIMTPILIAAALLQFAFLMFGDVIMYRWKDWQKKRREREYLRKRADLFRRVKTFVDSKKGGSQ